MGTAVNLDANYQQERILGYRGPRPTGSTNSSQYASDKGNTCTDGKDDGKIGFFSAVGNTIEGAGKTILNMAKSAIQHPFKTAAMIGVCCIPVVGPIVGAGLAAYGVASGVKTVAEGVSTAMSATSDAEAKDAWENIGGGATTAGLSAVALKGSVKAAKSQLGIGGGEGCKTVQEVKKVDGLGNKAKTAFKEGLKETGRNIETIGKAAHKKYENAKKTIGDNIEQNGVRNGIKKTAFDYAKNKLGEAGKKLDQAEQKITENKECKNFDKRVKELEASGKSKLDAINEAKNEFNTKGIDNHIENVTAKAEAQQAFNELKNSAPDGKTKWTSDDGVNYTIENENTIIAEKNGVTTKISSDGTAKTTYKDGSTKTDMVDGTTKYKIKTKKGTKYQTWTDDVTFYEKYTPTKGKTTYRRVDLDTPTPTSTEIKSHEYLMNTNKTYAKANEIIDTPTINKQIISKDGVTIINADEMIGVLDKEDN